MKNNLLKRMSDLDYLTDVSWVPRGTFKQGIAKAYVEKYGQCFNDGIRITKRHGQWHKEKV